MKKSTGDKGNIKFSGTRESPTDVTGERINQKNEGSRRSC